MVPFLVLLPLVEGNDMASDQSPITLLAALGPTALKTLGGLGLLLLGGRLVLSRLFELVAAARSDETFVALCLLTVTGASLTTQVRASCCCRAPSSTEEVLCGWSAGTCDSALWCGFGLTKKSAAASIGADDGCVVLQRLGFSDTLGAFCAGVLLSETNFRTQVDSEPFTSLSSALRNTA